MGRALALYTALRLLAFAVVFVLLSAVGLGGLVGVLLALLLSSLVSLVLLRRQRDAVTLGLEQRRLSRGQEKARLRGMLDDDPAQGGSADPGRRGSAEGPRGSEDRAQREP